MDHIAVLDTVVIIHSGYSTDHSVLCIQLLIISLPIVQEHVHKGRQQVHSLYNFVTSESDTDSRSHLIESKV